MQEDKQNFIALSLSICFPLSNSPTSLLIRIIYIFCVPQAALSWNKIIIQYHILH